MNKIAETKQLKADRPFYEPGWYRDLSNKADRPFYEPGWYRDLSNDEYHGSAGVSSSYLKKFLVNPPAQILYDGAQPIEPTANMKLGTAVHTLFLEPEKFDQEIAVIPNVDGRTKEGKAIKANFEIDNFGKTIITEADFIKAQEMVSSLNRFVEEDEILTAVLNDKIVESSIYWWFKSLDNDDETQYKEMFKVRPDIISTGHSVLLDLKTTDDATFTSFRWTIEKYFYHVSAYMYLEGVNQCKPLLSELGRFAYTNFWFLVVQNKPPYLVTYYELDKSYLEKGKHLYWQAIKNLYRAKQENWPGFPHEPRVIEPAPWDKIHII